MKYIVNNLGTQSINGSLTINGGLAVVGTASFEGNFVFDTISATAISVNDLTVNGNLTNIIDGSYRIGTYKALLTQTATFSGTALNNFGAGLIIGETYTITNYVSGDDFTNVANVTTGNINETGCEFIATGGEPLVWSNGSELISSGNLVVDVLENNLGYDINWSHAAFGGEGYYFASKTEDLMLIEPYSFPRESVEMIVQKSSPLEISSDFTPVTFNASLFIKDEIIGFENQDNSSLSSFPIITVGNRLYYTPVEIRHKQPKIKTVSIYSQLFAYTGSQNSSITDIYQSAFVITGTGSYYGEPGFIGNNSYNSNIYDYWTENNLEQGSTYIFDVIWGPGSATSSLAYVYYNNGGGGDIFFITPVDPDDTSWQNVDTADGTALTGIFNWPARISLHSPLIRKNNSWYC